MTLAGLPSGWRWWWWPSSLAGCPSSSPTSRGRSTRRTSPCRRASTPSSRGSVRSFNRLKDGDSLAYFWSQKYPPQWSPKWPRVPFLKWTPPYKRVLLIWGQTAKDFRCQIRVKISIESPPDHARKKVAIAVQGSIPTRGARHFSLISDMMAIFLVK